LARSVRLNARRADVRVDPNLSRLYT
jgi:hypothetical protein